MPRASLLLMSFVLAASLRGDPSEDLVAWSNPPSGWQWDKLGPTTWTVDRAAYAEIRHVSPLGADDSGDGSAAKPWRSVRRALAADVSAGRAAVLVAAGRYEEGVLQLRPGVDLFGGFDPAAWQRDIFRHATVLSGAGKDRVLLGADNCRVDGFVLEAGIAQGHGGAVLCEATSPAMTNNVFRRNRTLAPANYPHTTDRRRVRGHDGGAIALLHGSNADIRHNLFHDNETGIGYGGAVSAAHDCLPIIAHNVFWANRAGLTDQGGTRSGNGGAVGLLFSSRPALMFNLFVANETKGDGDGGAVFMEYFCWPEVRHNAFVGNISDDDGGGLDHQKFSYAKIRANLFYGNQAGKSGGGVHGDDSSAEIENNVFAYNRAVRQGGGLGGTHSWVRVLNNTFAHNVAQRNGGGIHVVNVKNAFLRPSIVRNNLLAFNAPDQAHFDTEPDIAYNIMHPGGFQPGYYNFGHPPGFADDGRKLDARGFRHDPATYTTTVAVAGDLPGASSVGRIVRIGGHWTMVRSQRAGELVLWGPAPAGAAEVEILPTFRLAPDSRAIKAGTYPDFPPFDADGDPRQYPAVDIGADEYRPAPAAK